MMKNFYKITLKTIILLTVSVLLSCDNRFVQEGNVNSFSFGLFGHNSYKFCKKKRPTFNKPYKNGVEPFRVCRNYQYYTCHIEYYCRGDEKCEFEAARYWLKRPPLTKKQKSSIKEPYCNRIKRQCDSAAMGDQTCRK